VFALAAVLIALLCVQFDAWDIAIMCAIASGLALIFAVYQACYLLRRPD
jgi:EamA domain-containing membrane protein RarD